MSCELKFPSLPGLEENVMTVGRIFQLQCSVTVLEGFDFSKAQLEMNESERLVLKLFKAESQAPQSITLEMTSYGAGQWSFENLTLTDGAHKIPLGKIQLEVKSVLPQDTKVEPYGPVGPLVIPIPWLYIAIVSVVVLTSLGALGLNLRRRFQRSSLLKKLRDYDTPLSPVQQFHAESRRWQRNYAFFHTLKDESDEALKVLREVDQQVRVYFIRRFQIPALEWSTRLIMNDLKKYHRKIHDENKEIILKWFTEVGRALKPGFALKAPDVIQLRDQARRLLETLDRSLEVKN